MKKNNKKCITCGAVYSYCPTCGADRYKPTWMNLYCSENCRTLFQKATDYTAGKLSIEDAKEYLSTADLSKRESLHHGVKKFVDEVLGAETPAATETVLTGQMADAEEEKPKESDTVTTTNNDEVVETVEAAETSAEESAPAPEDNAKTLYSRRKGRKRYSEENKESE